MFIDDQFLETRAKNFAKYWGQIPGDEKQQAQLFLTRFLEILGIRAEMVALFEKKVSIPGRANGGFIDLFWAGQFLVEMKSEGKDLDQAYRQAREYALNLKPEDVPKVILVCDFRRFEYYDLERLDENNEPTKTSFTLEELPKYFKLFYYLIEEGRERYAEQQEAINVRGAELLGKLRDRLERLKYPPNELASLLVRFLFCLFAEDTGIFPRNRFQNLVKEYENKPRFLGAIVESLFDVLNTPPEKRVPDDVFNGFAYIDGGLFAEKIPRVVFDDEAVRLLLDCCEFDWGKISPAVFGSIFQSILDPKTRREFGAHYTSEENILKLIRPLFLDRLTQEFDEIRTKFQARKYRSELKIFRQKLGKLKFLDPACGCGNFLVVTYRELCRLEREVLNELSQGVKKENFQKMLIADNVSLLDVSQFYGIEIEEFPSEIARVALWLTDHLACLDMQEAFGIYQPRIPLTTSPTIICDDALTIDWETVVPKKKLSYILGNPPYAGARLMTQRQKEGLLAVFLNAKNAGNLDYVAAWYRKAAEYIRGTEIEVGFVSTNSICQGEQVPALWKPLIQNEGIALNFAHQTFKWSNEARGNAAVFCVIIGFARFARKQKLLFSYDSVAAPANLPTVVQRINAYLTDAPDIWIESRQKPLCDVPLMSLGNQPIDGGFYLFTQEEKDEFLRLEPKAEKWFRPWIGSKEFINRDCRYFLYLRECSPSELKSLPKCLERVEAVRRFRLSSVRPVTRRLADTPREFAFTNISTGNYIVVPEVSSERRKYIPIGFLTPDVLCSNLVKIVPDATLYHFGVLTSAVHMAWTKYICGRLEMRYRYSNTIVYNNFPWPDATEERRAEIARLARKVLDARELYPDSSFADLYDPAATPPELVKAHAKLDERVDRLYRKKPFASDEERVALLFARYRKLTEKEEIDG